MSHSDFVILSSLLILPFIFCDFFPFSFLHIVISTDMSVNSTSYTDAYLFPQQFSLLFSLYTAMATCFQYRSTLFILTSFSITNIVLLLPFYIFILYLGLQRWWKQRSASTAAATSHSDIFTCHMVAIEMIGIFGCGFYCWGVFVSVIWWMMLGVYFFSVTSSGHIFIHILTCVERHLAVVHPITYVSLRNRGGVRIRNVTIGCAWLLFLGSFGPMCLGLDFIISQIFFLSTLSIVVVSFCSLSVLRTLIRPGPGTRGGDKEPVNQSKMRAFHTIMAIWGALLLRFGGHLLVILIYSSALSEPLRCGMLVSGVWFCLPSSLVLPLLFLHRAGKLMCCKEKTKSGQESE